MDLPLPWMLVASLVAVVLGGYWLWRTRRGVVRYRAFSRRSLVTTGEIISLRPSTNRRTGDTHWFPTIRFDAPGNRLVTAEANTGSTPAPGKPGERVQVRFDREDPDNFHLADSLAQPSTMNAFSGCLGVGVVLVGLAMAGVWALIVLVLKIPV
ncbi:MAG: DUF3592 domain-containing protein [Propionibacteriaceae bacterium]